MNLTLILRRPRYRSFNGEFAIDVSPEACDARQQQDRGRRFIRGASDELGCSCKRRPIVKRPRLGLGRVRYNSGAMSRSLRELYESSPFSSAQAPYVEEQYERYLADPASVSQEWRDFFGQFGRGGRPQPSLPAAAGTARVRAAARDAGPRRTRSHDGRREAVRRLAPHPVLREPRPPDRGHRPARPDAAADAARARPSLRRPHRSRHEHGFHTAAAPAASTSR